MTSRSVATFFAPCSYAPLPGYVGYYVAATGQEKPPLGGTVARGGAAAVGALVAFAVLSAVAIVAGTTLERALPFLEYGVGVALIAVGCFVVYGGSGSIHVMLPEQRASVLGFGLFGAVYSLAATACVLPLFLALVFRSLTMSPVETTLVLGSYAGGFAALMVTVTVAVAVGYNLARTGSPGTRTCSSGSRGSSSWLQDSGNCTWLACDGLDNHWLAGLEALERASRSISSSVGFDGFSDLHRTCSPVSGSISRC